MALLADQDAPASSDSPPEESAQPSRKPTLDERRRAYRIAVVGARSAGKLRVGGREIPVEILDESAGGFSAAVDNSCEWEIGQTILLEMASSWSQVRVMNITQQDAQTRLGLARLRDYGPAEVKPLPRISLANARRLLEVVKPVSGPIGKGLGLVAAAFFAGVAVYFVLERTAPSVEVVHNDQPFQRTRKLPQVTRPLPAPTSATKSEASRTVVKVPLEPLSIAPTPAPSAPSKSPRLAVAGEPSNAIVRRSQPELLLKPDVAKLLALSREQLEELKKLFEESRSAAWHAVKGVQLSIQERELQLGRLVLAVLTEKQREDLMRLMSVSDALRDDSSSQAPSPDDGK